MFENLKSVRNFEKEMQNMEIVSPLLSLEQKKQIDELKNELHHLQEIPKKFHLNFTEQAWCMYDWMSLSLMENANKAYEENGLDAGERVLIDFYKDPEEIKTRFFQLKVGTLANRFDYIRSAFEDHFAGNYKVSVLEFLIHIDGVVNEFTKEHGFFAKGTDVTAWDCLVGCDESLSKVQKIISKKREKTCYDEIRIPYRNGILHGRDLNYANEYVSCKCVSLLFAVANWMKMKETESKRQEKYEEETKPVTFSDIINRIKENSIDKEYIASWKRRTVTVGTDVPKTPEIDDCSEYPYLVPIVNMFAEWKSKNYGHLAKTLKKVFRKKGTEIIKCKEMFGRKEFVSFELIEVEEQACALTKIVVLANWKVNEESHSKQLIFGSCYENKKGKTASPWRHNGEWTLEPWDINGLHF